MSGRRAWSSMRKKQNTGTSSTEPQNDNDQAISPTGKDDKEEIPEVICEHMEHIRLERVKRKILKPSDWSCIECGTTEGVWACLTCGKFGCGRYQGEHALAHYEAYEHPLALEINHKYCHCYECDGYVANDNKKEELETLRKLLDNAQTNDDAVSTTRSGRVIRAPPKMQTTVEEFEDEDRLHTAIKHWRVRTFGNVFRRWRQHVAEAKYAKKTTGIPVSPLQSIRNGLTQSQTVILTKERTLIPGITGLRNLGNTCFMNTVLQALSNTADFCNFFIHLLGSPPSEGAPPAPVRFNGRLYVRRPTMECFEDAKQHAKVDDISLTMQLHTLLRVLWSGKWAVATPSALLEAVWKFVPKFRNRQQQDAQEFLCYLFDRLQEELQEVSDKPAEKPNEVEVKPQEKKSTRSTRVTTRSSSKSATTKSTTEENTDANKENTNLNSPKDLPRPADAPTIITEVFQGKLLSEVLCSNCKNKSTKIDPFLDLSVDIPVVCLAKPTRRKRFARVLTNIGSSSSKPKEKEEKEKAVDGKGKGKGKGKATENSTQNGSKKRKRDDETDVNDGKNDKLDSEEENSDDCKLEDCLYSFIKTESLEGYTCENCHTKADATKRLYLHTLPRVLCIVLKRFCWTTSSRAKIDTQVKFPFVLNLKEFAANGVQDTVYDLTSVVLHHGAGLLSGHYTSYCFNKLQNVWVHYNDSRVAFVTKEEIEREAPSKAYLLFYERRSNLAVLNPPKSFKLSSSLASFSPLTFSSPSKK